jgi:hypothetical protein
MLFFTIAKRRTFIINQKQVITHIDSGSDAIDASSAIKEACSLPPPTSQKQP